MERKVCEYNLNCNSKDIKRKEYFWVEAPEEFLIKKRWSKSPSGVNKIQVCEVCKVMINSNSN